MANPGSPFTEVPIRHAQLGPLSIGMRLPCHSEPVNFLQLGFDGLLPFPCHRTEAGMETRLVQDEYEIALEHRWAIEAIRAIQADVQFFGVALELVAGQAVDLQPLRIIQAFLP